MFSNADQAAILRFIFDGDAYKELALGVLAAGPSIRARIIQDFLTNLEAELGRKASQLGASWKVVNKLKTNPFKHWVPIYMTKQDWDKLYKISLSLDNPGGGDSSLECGATRISLASS